MLAKHLVTRAARTWEGHKTQAQLSLHLCGVPKNLNLSSLDLEVHATQDPPQKVPLQSNLETEQCRLGKHTCRERGKPSVAQTLRALPTHASDICLQFSSLTTTQVSLNK